MICDFPLLRDGALTSQRLLGKFPAKTVKGSGGIPPDPLDGPCSAVCIFNRKELAAYPVAALLKAKAGVDSATTIANKITGIRYSIRYFFMIYSR